VISLKLETKIMNFTVGFFRKKYNQVNSSVVNNMQYNLFTIFPLQSLGLFLLISSRISDLSVILTKYHYIILTDYPRIQFHRYIS
jgi:hypothetical protein